MWSKSRNIAKVDGLQAGQVSRVLKGEIQNWLADIRTTVWLLEQSGRVDMGRLRSGGLTPLGGKVIISLRKQIFTRHIFLKWLNKQFHTNAVTIKTYKQWTLSYPNTKLFQCCFNVHILVLDFITQKSILVIGNT